MFLVNVPGMFSCQIFFFFFFFNDTATTEIYTLSLHDALPISRFFPSIWLSRTSRCPTRSAGPFPPTRSEEHTSELQSRVDLVCRLLLEKKKHHKFIRAPIHVNKQKENTH